MKKISTAELKAHLGEYLGMVKEGETFYITSHRKPVAQLSPSQVDESLQIHPPDLAMGRLKGVQGIKLLSGGVDGVGELFKDRGRR